jgi:sulfur carrier protein
VQLQIEKANAFHLGTPPCIVSQVEQTLPEAEIMKFEIKLYAGLEENLPGGQRKSEAELREGATVGDALKFLTLEERFLAIILVNGVHAGPETVLREGDVLSIFPPLAGG